ncbi:MAG: xanthine dehydrogenase family protein molybdopterin-binding subunit [Acidimicrobiia bacterium]|nr:xanthine dehydrogenase family protein molybdopterin-binding subunit [Acidimicrobiia bacterium]
MTAIGVRIPRKEDARILVGKGRYVDDLAVPHMAHATFVRSPFAHADITSVNLVEARKSPGVVAAYSGSESAVDMPLIPTAAADDAPPRTPLTGDRVHYVGEPVVMVLAKDPRAAVNGAERVDVDYEPLPHVLDPWEALSPGAPLVHPDRGTNKIGEIHKVIGDPDDAFSKADHIVSRRLTVQRISASPMEPRAILAVPEPSTGHLTVWLSCQGPHTLRTWLAHIFELDESKLRIVAPDVGGGFGSKLNLYSDELAVIWAALELGIPVKWVETRTENFTSGVHARDQIHDAELALDADGKILALRSHFVGDLGAYFHFFTPVVPDLTIDTLTGNYDIPSVDIKLEKVFTNKMSIEALRGSGRAEATYVQERLIEEAARELGIDPVEMRLRNLVAPDQLPYRTPFGLTYTGGDYPALLKRAAELVGYQAVRTRQQQARKAGSHIGIGFATYNLLCGFSPSGHDWNPMKFFPGHESTLIRVDPQGKAVVYSGLSPQGQGSDTVVAQIAADQMQIPFDHITVTHGDTETIPFGGGTHGSRGAVVGGHAALLAAERVVEKARQVAAAMLEAAAEDIAYEDGVFTVVGSPEAMVSWREVAEEAHFLKRCGPMFEPGLEATAFYDPPDVNFAFGANAAVVEVDTETGKVKILDFVSVDDYGVGINPGIVDGQIHGGIAQGIGQALYEQVSHDESGQVPSASFAAYLLPSAMEVPRLTLDNMVSPSDTPLGVRGVGESGTLASPPAIANAVADALAPFGVRIDRTPLRPDVVWELLHP